MKNIKTKSSKPVTKSSMVFDYIEPDDLKKALESYTDKLDKLGIKYYFYNAPSKLIPQLSYGDDVVSGIDGIENYIDGLIQQAINGDIKADLINILHKCSSDHELADTIMKRYKLVRIKGT